jgi:hypothetical protein
MSIKIDKHAFDRLIADRRELIELLSSYNLNYIGVTPYGILDRINTRLPADDRFVILYNSYYTNSLLHNRNKWIDLESIEDLVPFNLS